MKQVNTMKNIKSMYNKVYGISYCNAQNLLVGFQPEWYTSGIYGWGADVYDFMDKAIATGYRPFGKVVPQPLVKEFDDKARENIKLYHDGKIKRWGTVVRRNAKLTMALLNECDKL